MVHAIGEIRCPLCLSPCPLVPTPHPPSPTNVTPSCGSLMQLQRAIVGEPNVSLLRSGRVMAAKSPAGFRHDPPDPLPLCSRCLDRGASDASRGYASLPAPEAVGLTVHPRLSPFKEYPAIVDFVCSLQNSSMAHLPQHGARAGMPQRQGSVGPWYQPQRHQVHRMASSPGSAIAVGSDFMSHLTMRHPKLEEHAWLTQSRGELSPPHHVPLCW